MYSKDYMRDEGRGSQRDEANGVGSEESEVRTGLWPIMITERLVIRVELCVAVIMDRNFC